MSARDVVEEGAEFRGLGGERSTHSAVVLLGILLARQPTLAALETQDQMISNNDMWSG